MEIITDFLQIKKEERKFVNASIKGCAQLVGIVNMITTAKGVVNLVMEFIFAVTRMVVVDTMRKRQEESKQLRSRLLLQTVPALHMFRSQDIKQ